MKWMLVLTLITIHLTIGCDLSSKNGLESEVDTTTVIIPTQEIENFTLTETKNGRKKFVATADYAEIYKDQNELNAFMLDVIFFGEDGDSSSFSTLTADSAFINQKTHSMTAIGNVVIVSEDSTILETDELIWDNETEKIQSDKFVKIRRGRDVLTGIGITTDPHLRHLEIKKDMKAFVEEVEF